MKNKKALIKTFTGLAISLGLVGWLVFSIDWQEVLKQLKTVDYFYFIPVTIIIFSQFIFRTIRWQYLVPHKESMTFRLSFDSNIIGNFVNYILPLRAGEIFRPYFLSRRSENNFSSCFAAVVIERFFDLSAVLILFAFTLMGASNLEPWMNQGAKALTFLALLIFIYIISVIVFPKFIENLTNRILDFLPEKVASFFKHFLDGLFAGAKVIKNKKNIFIILTCTSMVWFVTALQYYTLLFIFDLTPTFYSGILITVVIALAVAAPSAPGFIGVFQIACIAAFYLLGFDKETATTYALLSHLHMYLIVIIYGGYVMLHYGLKLKDLQVEKKT